MRQLDETGGRHVAAPALEIVIDAVASAVPAFFVMAMRVRREQHTTRLKRGAQLPQHARQLLAGDVKERRVGEYAVETALGQRELQEILLPYFGAAVGARHCGQARGAFEAYRDVAERRERLEVASRPAAEIEDRERRFALDRSQQRFDVLADVVIARAFAEILGMPVVVLQRDGGDFFQVLHWPKGKKGSEQLLLRTRLSAPWQMSAPGTLIDCSLQWTSRQNRAAPRPGGMHMHRFLVLARLLALGSLAWATPAGAADSKATTAAKHVPAAASGRPTLILSVTQEASEELRMSDILEDYGAFA